MIILNEKETGLNKSLDIKWLKIEDSVKCPGITWGDGERTLGFFSLIRV